MDHKSPTLEGTIQSKSIGVREAKMHLSRLLKMVQKGAEITLMDRNRPVGNIIPIQPESLPMEDRIKRLENQGIIEGLMKMKQEKTPPPILVSNNLAQRLLQKARNNES